MKQTLLEWEGAPTSFEEVQTRLVKTAGHVVGSFRSWEQTICEADQTQITGAGRSEMLKPVYRSFKEHLADLERLYTMALELGPPLRDLDEVEYRAVDVGAGQGSQAKESVETQAQGAGGNGVPGQPIWPQPNQQGTYALELAEKLEHTEKKSAASVHVLQVGPEEWISSWSVSLRVGGICPQLTRENAYASRDEAIVAAARTMATYLVCDRTGDRAVPKLKRWAENLIGQHGELLLRESQEALALAGG